MRVSFTQVYSLTNKEKESRVLTMRLSFNMRSLKTKRGVDEYSDPLMNSIVMKSLPIVLFADPDGLTVTSWKEVSKQTVSE